MESLAISLIDKAIESGFLDDKEHDKIMDLIHKDGIIDEIETKKLSELFTAIQNSKVKVIRSGTLKKTSNLDNLKNEAIERNNQNPSPRMMSVSAKTVTESPISNINHIEDKQEIFNSVLDIPIYQDQSKDNNSGFKKATERHLEIDINNSLWIKTGSMVAYRGDLSFRREGIAEHGLGKLIKRSITGESTPLTRVDGLGKVFLADHGKTINIVRLKGPGFFVQAEHILAFENSINWEVQPLFNVGTALAGGIFHLRFHGHGQVAFTTRFEPIVLRVTPENPLITDAKATVGWSSGIIPTLKTDINFQTLIGRTSGETIQLRLEGDGVVVVQP